MLRKNELPVSRIGKSVRVPADALHEMIRRGYGKTHKGKNLAIKKMLDGKWKRVFAVLPKSFEE